MKRLLVCTIASLATLVSAGVVQAQHYAGHCAACQVHGGTAEPFKDAWYQNSIWPRQYVQPSRRAICQAFDVMIANGWRRNNLLGKYDFDPATGDLTEAGRLRVQWILTQAPPNRRTIFVGRGVDADQTAERVAAVQSAAGAIAPALGPLDIQETYMVDEGRPAAAVDAVFTGFSTNQPPPILPASSGVTESTQ